MSGVFPSELTRRIKASWLSGLSRFSSSKKTGETSLAIGDVVHFVFPFRLAANDLFEFTGLVVDVLDVDTDVRRQCNGYAHPRSNAAFGSRVEVFVSINVLTKIDNDVVLATSSVVTVPNQ